METPPLNLEKVLDRAYLSYSQMISETGIESSYLLEKTYREITDSIPYLVNKYVNKNQRKLFWTDSYKPLLFEIAIASNTAAAVTRVSLKPVSLKPVSHRSSRQVRKWKKKVLRMHVGALQKTGILPGSWTLTWWIIRIFVIPFIKDLLFTDNED